MVAFLMPASSPGVSSSTARPALTFRPTQIHAQKHGCPVLRFRATGAGLDGHDGVEVIVFAGEQRLRFELANVSIGSGQFPAEVLQKFCAAGRWIPPWQAQCKFPVSRKRAELLSAAT